MRRAVIFLVLFILLVFPALIGQVSALNGPRFDNILIKIYATDAQEFAAFEAGQIEILDIPIDPAHLYLYLEPPLNESIVVCFYEGFDTFQFDINNNETIPSNPGVIQPTSDPWFRTAMQYVVDKDYIVTTILGGLATRIDSPLPPALGAWYDTSVQHYGYNHAQAEAILDAHGYTMGTEWRINPATGTDMNPLEFYIRADDTIGRTPAGLYFAAELEGIDIPVNELVVDRSICNQKVMQENDYNLYTGSSALTRDPDWLYFGYHSSMYWGPGSLNYNHINDTLYDASSYNVYAATDVSTAMTNAYAAQERLMNRPDDPTLGISAFIPLWSTAGYSAFRRPSLGYAVNMNGQGVTNWWTFYVGRLTTGDTGGTVNWGFKTDVQQLNPLYSQWTWDWYVLNEIYDPLLRYNPYNVAQDQAWVASSWGTTTWAGGSLLTFTLEDGITFHDGTPLTVADVKFTLDYIRNYSDCWLYPNVADIDHVDVDTVQRKVYVYMDVTTIWALHWIMGLPILPKHIWETIIDPTGFSPEPTLIGSGPYTFVEYVPGDHFTLTANRNYFKQVHPITDINLDGNGYWDMSDLIAMVVSLGRQRGEVGYDIRTDIVAPFDIVDICDWATYIGYAWGGTYDTAVTLISLNETIVEPGSTVNINVTIENQGDIQAFDLNVELYANETLVGTQMIDQLNDHTSTTLVFYWDTTGFGYGTYRIKAISQMYPSVEPETADNTLVDGVVAVTIPGDVNGDLTVDIFDLIIIATAYGSTPGEPNWNPAADLVQDDIIDIFDLIYIANRYGDTIP